jgi:hypothetical protein
VLISAPQKNPEKRSDLDFSVGKPPMGAEKRLMIFLAGAAEKRGSFTASLGQKNWNT